MPLSWLVAGIFAWFLLGAALSAKARRGMGSGVIDYFLANRTVGGFVSAMSYSATTYSAFMMVGLVGLTYKGGIASLGFELTYLVGTVFLLVLFAPRYWLAGRRYGLMTPSELLSTRYGSKWVGATASLLCLVTLVPYASVQLMGMGYLLEGVSGGAFPFWAGMAVAAVITVVFSIWAGLRSVALTDALQASIMLVACCLLVAFIALFLFPGGWLNAMEARPDLLKVSWPFPMFLGLTLPWTFFALTNPQVVQRLYAPKDIRSIRGMVAGFSAFGFLYTVLCVLLGLSAAVLVPGLKNPDGAMAALLTKVPRGLALLVVLSIFAAAVSTLNSIILTLSSMFGRDLLRAAFPLSEEKELVWGKLLIPVLTVACYAFGSLKLGLIAVLSSMASAGLMAQLPVILGAFFWKRATAAGAIAGMAAGAVVTGALYLGKVNLLGHWPPVWGLAASTAAFVIVSLWTRAEAAGASFIDSVESDVRETFWPNNKA
jgi:SSS family solute:Na+ symporter